MMLLWRVVSIFVLLIAFQIAVAHVVVREKEAKRRWQHAVTGHLIVQVSYLLPLNISIGALIVGVLGILYVRWYQPGFYLKVFGPLLRPEERRSNSKQPPGAFYFLVGTVVTAWAIPINEARYAVSCLSFCDPMAAWIGQTIKSPRVIGSASLAGCVACFVTALFVGFLYLHTTTQIVVGALACTLAEALPYGNDNLQIPIITGATVTYLAY